MALNKCSDWGGPVGPGSSKQSPMSRHRRATPGGTRQDGDDGDRKRHRQRRQGAVTAAATGNGSGNGDRERRRRRRQGARHDGRGQQSCGNDRLWAVDRLSRGLSKGENSSYISHLMVSGKFSPGAGQQRRAAKHSNRHRRTATDTDSSGPHRVSLGGCRDSIPLQATELRRS